MDYITEITIVLKADNGKRFNEGSDIAFTKINKKTNRHDHYIGNINRIYDDCIILENVEINREPVDGIIAIMIEEIEPNSCNYVSEDGKTIYNYYALFFTNLEYYTDSLVDADAALYEVRNFIKNLQVDGLEDCRMDDFESLYIQ